MLSKIESEGFFTSSTITLLAGCGICSIAVSEAISADETVPLSISKLMISSEHK